MPWHPATIVRVLPARAPLAALGALAALACGGSNKPPEAPEPEPEAAATPPVPPPETEEDRENKRHAAATAIIPDGSTCLPAELKNPTAPRLELAAIGSDAVVCAVDRERTRLLGPIGCWKIEVTGPKAGALIYQKPGPLPGRGFAVMFDDRCARGYCLPKDATVPTDTVAHMAWNLEGSKVAVLSGDVVHIFDSASKAHEASFSIRGEKGVTSEPIAMHWNGDAIFVEASDATTSPVWVFRTEASPIGAPVGPIEVLGGREKTPLSTRNGSFMLLDRERVAISEHGFSTLTIYETDSGKRTKLVRKIPPPQCKKGELEALWQDPSANASAKCKDFMTKNYAHLIGADAVAGTKNLLVLLRGPRLGELAVIDAKTLAERKTIEMPWCDGASASAAPAGGGAASSAAADADAEEDKAAPAEKPARRAKVAPKAEKAGDPDSGGE
jgi:hypothetical protein